MSTTTDVAIIGAGPYGLSLAAHLAAANVSVRVFGQPMQFWRTNMPEGMVLKSEGFASNLWHPDGALTLRDFCADRGLPYKIQAFRSQWGRSALTAKHSRSVSCRCWTNGR